jgi:HEPN domain-containing protein
MKALQLFMDEEDYSDVVREAQEIVELLLKGVLRKNGIEPPKLHDVGPLIIEVKDKFSDSLKADVEKAAEISKWLRKEREFAFYGDIDLIPTEEYSKADAERAMRDALFILEWARPSFAE